MERSNAIVNKSIERFATIKSVEEAVEFLGKFINTVSGTKRKVIAIFFPNFFKAEEICTEEADLIASSKRRIEHLKDVSALEGKSLCGVHNAGMFSSFRRIHIIKQSFVSLNYYKRIVVVNTTS